MKKLVLVAAMVMGVATLAHANEIERFSYKPTSQEACSEAQDQIKDALVNPYNECSRQGGKFVISTNDPVISPSRAWQGKPMYKCSQTVSYLCGSK